MQDIPARTPLPVRRTPSRDRAERHRRRAVAGARDLTRLLAGRPDLCGVHAPADLLADMVTWSA